MLHRTVGGFGRPLQMRPVQIVILDVERLAGIALLRLLILEESVKELIHFVFENVRVRQYLIFRLAIEEQPGELVPDHRFDWRQLLLLLQMLLLYSRLFYMHDLIGRLLLFF